MSSKHSERQGDFEHLQLTATRPDADGSDVTARCKATSVIAGSDQKPRLAELKELSLSFSSDPDMQKLLQLLCIEQRMKAPISCDRSRSSTASTLPPPMKFCRKAKTPAPVL